MFSAHLHNYRLEEKAKQPLIYLLVSAAVQAKARQLQQTGRTEVQQQLEQQELLNGRVLRDVVCVCIFRRMSPRPLTRPVKSLQLLGLMLSSVSYEAEVAAVSVAAVTRARAAASLTALAKHRTTRKCNLNTSSFPC
jgi:hypothetical protein